MKKIKKQVNKGKVLFTLSALAFISLPVLAQNKNDGFIDGAEGKLLLRNYFIDKNYVDPSARKNYSREWTQSFILDLKSGYTPGLVGFGVDGLGLLSVKLDGGKGTTGTGLLPLDSPNSYGYAGLTAKSKILKTELKYGDLRPRTPVVIASDTRSLPQVFRGLELGSKEIDGLNLQLSMLNKGKARNSDTMEKLTYNNVEGGDFFYGGANYRLTPDVSFSYWASQFDDIYQQQYANYTQFYTINEVKFGADLNYWWGKDTGSANAGHLDNKTFSAAFSTAYKDHTLTFGYQHLEGTTKWMRLDGAGGGYLSNDSLTNSFDLPKERSYQIRHEYDFGRIGLPGFSIMNRYTKGTNIHTASMDDGKEWVRESELAYVIQSGTLKDLSIRFRNLTLRQNHGNRNENENRLIINYPIVLF